MASNLTVTNDPRVLSNAALAALFEGGAEGADRYAFWAAATQGEDAPSPALEYALAQDILALFGQEPAQKLYALRAPMLSRAQSSLRAKTAQRLGNGPKVRSDGAGLLSLNKLSFPWRGFFALAAAVLRLERFSGERAAPIEREVFISTDAVTVLPYDPESDEVLLVEQFRMGPWARGENMAWLIEPVAGRIDAGETPQMAARREAMEEAGVELAALYDVAEYYPSPGILSEYLYSKVAIADLSRAKAGLYGLAEEGEDIRSHIIPFETAMAWAAAGRLASGPALLSLLWLERERPRLRHEFARKPRG